MRQYSASSPAQFLHWYQDSFVKGSFSHSRPKGSLSLRPMSQRRDYSNELLHISGDDRYELDLRLLQDIAYRIAHYQSLLLAIMSRSRSTRYGSPVVHHDGRYATGVIVNVASCASRAALVSQDLVMRMSCLMMAILCFLVTTPLTKLSRYKCSHELDVGPDFPVREKLIVHADFRKPSS